MSNKIWLEAWVLGLILVAGCNVPPDPRRTNFRVEGPGGSAQYDEKTGLLKRIDVDQNKNGRMETFSYWDGTRLDRIEVDQDEDGRIDRWERYDAHRKMTSVGSSSRDDAIEDTRTYPDEKGFLTRIETDTDRDGMIDKRETFVSKPGAPDKRVLHMVELGIDKAGRPARRLYYTADGSFERSEARPSGGEALEGLASRDPL